MIRLVSIGLVGVLSAAGAAQAAPVTFSASGGGRSASAEFEVVGSSLKITLTNTATNDITQPIFVLTGVYFDITGGPMTLSRTSAVLKAGSTVVSPGNVEPQPASGVVGGEWAYKSGLTGTPGGGDYGISSSGLGLFGPGDRFPGLNLDGPDTPDGLQYGITTAGDDPNTNNGGTNTPLIKNAVVFTLGLPAAGFDIGRIANIGFQYGTSLTEPNLTVPPPQVVVVPLPPAAAAGMSSLAAAALVTVIRRRRLKA